MHWMIRVICWRDTVEIILQTACIFGILYCPPLESIGRHSIPLSVRRSAIKIGCLHPIKYGYVSSYLIPIHRCHIKTHIKPFLVFGQFKQFLIIGLRMYGNSVPSRSFFIKIIPDRNFLSTMAGYNNPFLLCNLYVPAGSIFKPSADIFQGAGNIQDNRGRRLDIHSSSMEGFRCIWPLSLFLYIPGQVPADKETTFRKHGLQVGRNLFKPFLLYGCVRNIYKRKKLKKPAKVCINKLALEVERIRLQFKRALKERPQVALKKCSGQISELLRLQ